MMGRQTGVGGRVGRWRGADAGGRALDWQDVKGANSLALATSEEFLRMWLSVGIVKVGAMLLLQCSSFSFGRVLEMKPEELSVKVELCIASHKTEEEEERRGGRLFSKKPILSRLNCFPGTWDDNIKSRNETTHKISAHVQMID